MLADVRGSDYIHLTNRHEISIVMKKIVATLSALCFLPLGYAGNTGSFVPSINPFVSLQGAYNWHSIVGLPINNVPPHHTNQPWGGRAAFGITINRTQHISLSNEVGWSYYGKTTINAPERYINISTMNGVDLLVGILYRQNKAEWFAKAGALLQNLYTDHSSLNIRNKIDHTKITLTLKNKETQILPEIMVGGMYKINNHIGVSLAYMQAFGSTYVVQISGDGTINKNVQNPTVHAVLFGLRYTI